MKVEYIDGYDFRKALAAGAQTLAENKELVDSLNVFPVPDGDTGTNMYLTMLAAAKEVDKVSGGSIGRVASAASMGSLMGARGNSGVIFSQFVRGFSRFVEQYERIGASQLAQAFQQAVNTAYQAVMKPVEGTILTVAREGARAALELSKREKDIIKVLDRAIEQAEKTLAKTPEMLPALKEAGVVDAGGKGLLLFMKGCRRGLLDQGVYVEEVPNRRATVPPQALPTTKPVLSVDQDVTEEEFFDDHSGVAFGYCTEFILKGKDLCIDSIRRDLQDFGDCLLVVGTDEMVKIHIHTNSPGVILEYGVKLGSLTGIDINNMREQKKEFEGQRTTDVGDQNGAGVQQKEVAIVAVVVGEGIEEIFKSLGVDDVIRGGQTMNPSAEDLVNAVSRTDAKKVIILPNNGNVILTANQVRELVSAELEVVPTKTIPQGLAALVAFNPEATFGENVSNMKEAFQNVKTGEVTFAVRNSTYNGVEVAEKDFIGIVDGQLRVAGKVCEEVVRNLVSEMVEEDSELITIFYGQNVTGSVAAKLSEQIAEDYPGLEVDIQYGGQPLYYYIISVE